MSDLPTLTESDVRNWTQPRFYERGVGYFNGDRIQRPRREGPLLKAECQGSRPNPYHLEAELDEEGIAWAECSCPVGGGGRCKHVVALLLTWVESPEDFSERDPLEQVLRRHSKDRLVQLILKMVERHPDLERLVSLSSKGAESPDPEELRSQIQSVFDGVAYDTDPYYAPQEVADDLEPFVTLGDDFAEHGRFEDAATVYRLVIEGIRENYMDFRDEEGDLGSQIHTCVRRLGTVLEETDDPDLRESILRTLFETYRWDLDLGGFGLGDWAYDVILEEATPDERQLVAGWVRDVLPELDRPEDDDRRTIFIGGGSTSWDSSDWKREALGGFLLQLEADTLDDEDYLRICRETGRLNELVDRLLELDRLEEALDAARRATDLDVSRLASTFEAHDAGAALRDLVLDRLDEDTDRRLVEWLRDYVEEHGDLEHALELSIRLFWSRSTPDAYLRLKSIAQALDRWEEVRSDLQAQLREQGQYGILTRLHLVDDNVEAALETVPKVERSSSWRYSSSSLKIDVAEAAEEEHPDAAIELYTDRAEALIADRGRGNYRQAADLLRRVKAIYEREDQSDAWQSYLDTLYEKELHRLPAARDEFEKADLL